MPARPYRLLYPLRTYLVASGSYPEEYNVMTADWVTVVSSQPFYVAVSIAPERYTYRLVKKHGEFVIAVPGWDLLGEVWLAGSLSGPAKLRELRLTFERGRRVKAPVIREAVANLECRVLESKLYGDHELFIGEVVYTHHSPRAYDDFTPRPDLKVILHLSGNMFLSNETVVTSV